MSNQLVTDRMLEGVRNAKAEAKSAENEFDRRNRDIQRKTSRSIDLFGGHATSQVADIMTICPECADLTNLRVSALIRQMIGVSVERIEDKRKAYFCLL